MGTFRGTLKETYMPYTLAEFKARDGSPFEILFCDRAHFDDYMYNVFIGFRPGPSSMFYRTDPFILSHTISCRMAGVCVSVRSCVPAAPLTPEALEQLTKREHVFLPRAKKVATTL